MELPKFVIIIPSYNNEKYIIKNLSSIFIQKYPYYRIIYIDDNSSDNTYNIVKGLVSKYNKWDIFSLYRQSIRYYASGNRYFAYHLCNDNEILVMLDGDDWFSNDKVLLRLSLEYKKGSLVTYGSYRFYKNNRFLPGIFGNELFPKHILLNKDFRKYRWTSQHLRTGYAKLFKKIKLKDLLDAENEFLKCCTDLAEMMPVLEMASPRISMIPDCLYIYNKEASLQNSNSYFNRNKNPIEKFYREYVETRIKTTPKYNINIGDEIKYKIDENITEPYRSKCLALLKTTGIEYIGLNLKLIHQKCLYNPKIKIGYYKNKLVLSIDKVDLDTIDIWIL